MNTLDILIAARAEIVKGWTQDPDCKGDLGSSEDGTVCAAGAIWRVEGTGNHRTLDALEREVQRLGGRFVCVAEFNDDAATTKADVLALYDRAINSLVPVGDSAHVHTVAA